MRKRELFSQCLVYIDYDLIKIINIKTKSLLVGWIHELHKALEMLGVSLQFDDEAEVEENTDKPVKITAQDLYNKSVFIFDKINKLKMVKKDFTDYRNYSQKIREGLAYKSYYEGCKTVLGEVSELKCFDGIPLLVDYTDFVNGKDLLLYKDSLTKRRMWKEKILKYMTLVGRLKGIEFILKLVDKSEENIKDSIEEYLDFCKSELEKTNHKIISEWLYKAYKLRNIFNEYYNIWGQLSICDSIQKQLQPFYLPAYFKLNWFIDSWNIVFFSLVEKEKIANEYLVGSTLQRSSQVHKNTSGPLPNSRINFVSRSPSPSVQNKKKFKLQEKISKEDIKNRFEKCTAVVNKLKKILSLIQDCEKLGSDKTKEMCEEMLNEEQKEITTFEKVLSLGTCFLLIISIFTHHFCI